MAAISNVTSNSTVMTVGVSEGEQATLVARVFDNPDLLGLVARRLDPSALNALSLVSKQARDAAAPYRVLKVTADNIDGIVAYYSKTGSSKIGLDLHRFSADSLVDLSLLLKENPDFAAKVTGLNFETNAFLTDDLLTEMLNLTPNLEMLDVGSTTISQLPVKQFSAFKALSLSCNKNMTDEALSGFLSHNAATIERLNLSATTLSLFPEADMPKLQVLNLSGAVGFITPAHLVGRRQPIGASVWDREALNAFKAQYPNVAVGDP